jgi:hypothetical protein
MGCVIVTYLIILGNMNESYIPKYGNYQLQAAGEISKYRAETGICLRLRLLFDPEYKTSTSSETSANFYQTTWCHIPEDTVPLVAGFDLGCWKSVASQEIPRLLRTLDISLLSPINPLNITTSYAFKNHFITVLLLTPTSHTRPLPLGLLTEVLCACYTSCQSHP